MRALPWGASSRIVTIGASVRGREGGLAASGELEWGSDTQVAFYWLSFPAFTGETIPTSKANETCDCLSFFISVPNSTFVTCLAPDASQVQVGTTTQVVIGQTVPEPASIVLAGAALVGLVRVG